jgi:amino acid adenylation domain-containing protein/non-ribosomal peptide synthase protein (TIGR01720 family)
MQNNTIEGYRLSPQQQRQWVLQQHSERSPYRVQVQVLIEGNVDRDALMKALFAVISRHEILNTTFQHLPGMSLPVQVINKPQVPSPQIYDLSHLNSSAQEIQIDALFQQALELPFDLQQSPPIHLFLIKLQTERQILILGLPALCSDRPSLNRLVYELSQSYAALLKDDELPKSEMQFADVAEWQHELLESDDTEAGRNYWRKPKFVDGAQLELSFEQKRKDASFQPKAWTIALAPEISVKLEQLSREYKVTEAALLQSCWQILLWRLTQSSGLIVATSCDGRNQDELKGVLGLLAKYLPVQLELHAGLTFHDVASQANELVREADEWQEYFSFDQIIGSQGSGNQFRFFPFSFDYDEQQAEYDAADVNFTITRQYDCIEPYKLKLSCWRQERGLTAELHYDSSLFNTNDIERLAGEFQTIVTALFNHPEIAIGQAEILSASERYRLLVEWNWTDIAEYQAECVHRLFELQVEQTPEQIAVEFGGERVSYRELNERANRLGRYLREQGVGPEVVVGLCLERSVEMVVGVLGVLKAGGAYLPLDPGYPLERLSFMLEETAVPVLLTQERLLDQLPAHWGQVLCLDTEWAEQEGDYEGENIPSEVRVENLAYVIYTSGSTGRPKGVSVTHHGLRNLAQAQQRAFGLSPDDRVMQFASLSFDASVWELFGTLIAGGTLCLPDPRAALVGEDWVAEMERQGINVVTVPPSLLAMTEAGAVGQLRSLIVAGEACSRRVAAAWSEKVERFVNAYGPSETTVCASINADVKRELEENDGREPSIGRVIEHTELYIVDEQMQPVPVGVIGELFIGGVGLARGYWRRPELTAEKFVPHPFSERAGARLYRTGDLARYLADGRVEFLGRRDQQVKLRGYRIELGEIEAVLRSQPGVQDAVVVVQEGAGGEKRLVGYVVRAEEAAAVTMSEWRSRLSEQLPEYMIPAVIVELRELPLTVNGKVDRRALPEPDTARPELEASYEAPRNEVEAELCRIWAAVLGLERVGIHDNFFELGGDSILSIQIVARANQKGLRLAPRHLFEKRTIAAVAAAVDTTPKLRTEQGEVSGQQRLTPSQQWFFAQSFVEPHHWNQTMLAPVSGRLQPELLRAAVEALLRHHDALRLRFSHDENEGWQAHYAAVSSEAPLTVYDLSGVPEAAQADEIERLTAAAQASLDLSAGPLLRVHYYDLGAERGGQLQVVVHHLAMDIVSWGILLEDLQQGYKQLEQGAGEVQLPAKTTSYQQWAEVLQEYAQSEQLAAQVDYWTNPERGGIGRLPVDGSGTHLVAAAQQVTVRLTREETQRLLTEVLKATRAQVHEVLLTALGASLSEWSGEKRVLIEVESHGREETVGAVDLTRTVGWFTVLYPLVVEVGEGSWSEKLRRVKEQQRQVPQGGIGYGVLRYLSGASEVREQLAGQPQAEVSFSYAGSGEVEQPREGILAGPAQENCAATYSPRGSRSHMLEINANVVGGELVVHWIYSEGVHRGETIEQVAQQMLRAIKEIIQETSQSTTPLFSTADFPAAGLSQQELDNLMAVLD